MKDSQIASVLIVGAIVVIAAYFFTFSESFSASATAETGHQDSIVRHTKFI
jgi:hypothetical protein